MKFKNKLVKIAVKAANTGINGIGKFITLVDPDAKKIIIEPGLSLFLMSDGLTIEVYDTGPYHPEYLFAHGNIVFSYQVDDLNGAVYRLREAGSVLLGDIENLSDSYRYCHMLINQRIVIGLFEHGAQTPPEVKSRSNSIIS